MSYTSNVPVTPGAVPVPLQVGAIPPAGFTLINRADNGGTVWVAAGPNGAQLPLTPGGSLTWTDLTTYPYLSLTPGATLPETVVVTDQVKDYANPEAVAAATAVQLAGEGLPSTFLDTGLGTYRIGTTLSTPPIIVGQSASLVVSAQWAAAVPAGNGVLKLKFDDPAVPDLAPVFVTLTAGNAISRELFAWRVPVLAPRLTITNRTTDSADAFVSVAGTNRTAPAVQQLDTAGGAYLLRASAPTTASAMLVASNGTTPVPGASPFSRATGAVQLAVFVAFGTTGFLFANFVDPAGVTVQAPIRVASNVQVTAFSHPPVPVWWSYTPDSAVAGNFCNLHVLQS